MSDTPLKRITELQEFWALQPGDFAAIDSSSRGTGKFDLGSFVDAAQGAGLVWDEDAGCYTNQSVSRMLSLRRDGLAYGVSIPKGSATACTKTAANASIPSPTPGYIGHPAVDPYVSLGPFRHHDVNGYVDDDGMPHVTAVEGDGRFKRDGSNGDVWVLAPVLYWSMDESGDSSVELSISDTLLPGMAAQPQAYLPDGTLRPYMLYAKYVGSKDANDHMASVSGKYPWIRHPTHDALITDCQNATTGYSGKSIADDWYPRVMFLLKYATKDTQSVFKGCSDYQVQCAPTVEETGVKRVIVAKTNAANIHVGSSFMLGTHTSSSTDRNQAYNCNTFDGLRVLKVEDYDTNNAAVYFDTDTTFTTHTTDLLSTAPWYSGSLDAVEGDGAITQAGLTNGHEPFKLQGIELMVGINEIVADVIIGGTSANGWEVCVNYDSRNEATSLTSDYTHTGKYFESGSGNGWHYPLYPSNAGGILVGQGTGGSQTTGTCDGHYTNAKGNGTREWLGGGNLANPGSAGLWCVSAGHALTSANWILGSRLSVTGRGRAA